MILDMVSYILITGCCFRLLLQLYNHASTTRGQETPPYHHNPTKNDADLLSCSAQEEQEH